MIQVYKEKIAEQDEVEQVRANTAATMYHKTKDEADAILITGILPASM